MSPAKRKLRIGAPVLGVSVCVIKDGRVLLTQRAKAPFENKWSLPGGQVERGERLAEAALREICEETGISAKLRGIFEWAEIVDEERHFVIAVFLAEWTSGTAVASSDAKAARWVGAEEIDTLELTPGLDKILRKAFRC